MATREQFLKQLWIDTIDSVLREHWIDHSIRESEQNKKLPFSDVGLALKRLLALGASRQDLSVIVRQGAYEGVFGTLYALNDPGVDDNDIEMLHESLLSADPSGRDGCPE